MRKQELLKELPSHVKDYNGLMDMFTNIRSNDFFNHGDLSYYHKVLSLFDNPEKSLGKVVYVTGTNGKGSVTWKSARSIEAMPSDHAIKVGLYVSPNIYEFEERISINGKPIAQTDMVKYANIILEKLYPKSLSTELDADDFRIGMVGILATIAFLYFRDQQVDYSVIEGGIGVKLDHTNVVNPAISVITSIALDHVPMLGNNVEEIAEDKAHIIRTGVPVVIGPRVRFAGEALSRILKKAESMKLLDNEIVQVQCPLKNVFELDNQETAKAILRTLFGSQFQFKDVFYTSPPGRYHKIFYRVAGQEIPCIFDVGHNADGFNATFSRCVNDFQGYKFILMCGISPTKNIIDIGKVINELPNLGSVLLYNDNFRLSATSEISKHLRDDLDVKNYDENLGIDSHLEAIIKNSDQKYCVIVIGSFYTVKGISTAMKVNLCELRNVHMPNAQLLVAPNIENTLWDREQDEQVSNKKEAVSENIFHH